MVENTSNATLLKEVCVGLAAVVFVTFAAKRRARAKQFTGPPSQSFDFYSTAEQVTKGINLDNKTFVVTGSTSGIGLETVRVLALRGATVFALGRTREKVLEATKSLQGGKIVPVQCDLSNPETIKSAMKEIESKTRKLDGIICNAGIMAVPKLELIHGVESQVFTNYIAHFFLVTRLLPLLTEAGRVVMLSSGAHLSAPPAGIEFSNLDGSHHYSAWEFYSISKLCPVLFAQSLTEQFQGTSRLAFSVHPGMIRTGLQRHLNPMLDFALSVFLPLFFEPWKSVEQGAATQVFAAVHPEAHAQAQSTHYLHDCREHTVHPACTKQLADQLYQVSESICKTL